MYPNGDKYYYKNGIKIKWNIKSKLMNIKQ
jgi:hypothetical protein